MLASAAMADVMPYASVIPNASAESFRFISKLLVVFDAVIEGPGTDAALVARCQCGFAGGCRHAWISRSRCRSRRSFSRIGSQSRAAGGVGGVPDDVVGVASCGGQVALYQRRVPVFGVAQTPVAVLDALDGQVNDRGFDGFLDAKLRRFVVRDARFEFQQVRVVDELVDVGGDLV